MAEPQYQVLGEGIERQNNLLGTPADVAPVLFHPAVSSCDFGGSGIVLKSCLEKIKIHSK
jgi:hypothetical protein